MDYSKPYHDMAMIYDLATDDIDYAQWYRAIKSLFARHNIAARHVLELGAGTGNMTAQLIADGIRVTVAEPALPMLTVLQEKLHRQMRALSFFNGDIMQLTSSVQYDLIAAFLDVLNYIPPRQLAQFFERAAHLLRPSGHMLMDWSSDYKFKHDLADQTIAESHEDFAFIWTNYYEAPVLTFDFTLFSEGEDGLYRRSVERHSQYAHSAAQLADAYRPYFDCIALLGDDYRAVEASTRRYHLLLKGKS